MKFCFDIDLLLISNNYLYTYASIKSNIKTLEKKVKTIKVYF